MSREFIAVPLSHQSATGHGVQVITAPTSPSAAQQGNQGTALVVKKLTSFPSSYDSAPSGKPSSCNTAYFRCAPRPLSTDKGHQKLKIKVFERHPYTRQAFLPMGRDSKQRAYVVVTTEDDNGKPDLRKVKAFLAMGNQGIVYDANRWHSPMCALDDIVEFAVVQNENGVPEEDCVEYHLNEDQAVDIILDSDMKSKL